MSLALASAIQASRCRPRRSRSIPAKSPTGRSTVKGLATVQNPREVGLLLLGAFGCRADDSAGHLAWRVRRRRVRAGWSRTGAPGLQQPAHGSLGATVSAGAEFMGESGGVGATFLPPLREIVEVGVELPTPPGDLGEQFLGGSGIYVAAD